jgi:hypothetical protein
VLIEFFFFKPISFLVGVVFVGGPTVAAVWRRQTFTAAVENIAPETTRSIFEEHLPTFAALLKDQPDDPLGTRTVLEDAYRFSRMLHGATAVARRRRTSCRRVLPLVHTRARSSRSNHLPGQGVAKPARPGSLLEIRQTWWYVENRLYVNVHFWYELSWVQRATNANFRVVLE